MRLLAALLWLFLLPTFYAQSDGRPKIAPIPTSRNPTNDLQIVSRSDEGLNEVLQFVKKHPDLFSKARPGVMTLEEKAQVRNTWKRFVDYQLALQSIGSNYKDYYKLTG